MAIDLESGVVYDLENDVDYHLENEGAGVTTVGLLTVGSPAYATTSRAAQAAGLLPIPTGASATARKDTGLAGVLSVQAQAQSTLNTSRSTAGVLETAVQVSSMIGSVLDVSKTGLLIVTAAGQVGTDRKDITPAALLAVTARQQSTISSVRTKTGRLDTGVHLRALVGSVLDVSKTGLLVVFTAELAGTARKDSRPTGLLIAVTAQQSTGGATSILRVDLGLTVGQLRSVPHFLLGPLVPSVAALINGFRAVNQVTDFAAVTEVGALEAFPPISIADFDDGALIGGLESSPPVTVGKFNPVTSVGPIREDK